jgi:hypothetical protein
MKKTRETQDYGSHVTAGTLVIGFLGGLGIVIYGESLLGDIQGTGDLHPGSSANWQVDMGAACMGAAAFIDIFFTEIDGLKAACKSTVTMCALDEISQLEAANTLGVSVASIKGRISPIRPSEKVWVRLRRRRRMSPRLYKRIHGLP